MWEEILKAIPIYLLSALKVVFGPTMGYAAGLHWVTSLIVTFAGMMTSVVLITLFGSLLQKGFLKNWFAKREEKAKNSKWKRYGLIGIAILTPLLLTPIGGSLLAVIGGYPRARILLFMTISAAVFSVAATSAMYIFGPPAIEYVKSLFP
jgi:membrane protein YqaA with SNARE-associated domain